MISVALIVPNDCIIDTIRVNIFAIDLIIFILVAGQVRRFLSVGTGLGCGCLADLSSSVYMRKPAFRLSAHSLVSIVGTFEHMFGGTCAPSLAVPECGKGNADRGCRIHSNVGISAVVVSAVSTEEMNTRRYSFGGRIVRKIAHVTCRACPFLQEVLTDCNLARIVDIAAVGSLRTRT